MVGVSSTSNGGMTERTMLVRSDFFLEGLVLADGTKPKLKGLNQRPSTDHAGRREASVAIWTHSRPVKRVDIPVLNISGRLSSMQHDMIFVPDKDSFAREAATVRA